MRQHQRIYTTDKSERENNTFWTFDTQKSCSKIWVGLGYQFVAQTLTSAEQTNLIIIKLYDNYGAVTLKDLKSLFSKLK